MSVMCCVWMFLGVHVGVGMCVCYGVGLASAGGLVAAVLQPVLKLACK